MPSTVRVFCSAVRTTVKVLVGSKNPVKVESVKTALQRCFPGKTYVVQGLSVPSNVSEQPIGDHETLLGATNRVNNLCQLPESEDADMCIAIEGGIGYQADYFERLNITQETFSDGGTGDALEKRENLSFQQKVRQRKGVPGTASHLECYAWVVVRRKSDHDHGYNQDSTARSATFILPEAITELVRQGKELGDATDEVFKTFKVGYGSGTVGRLTSTDEAPNGVLTREMYYEHAVICALAPLMRPDLFPEFNT